MSQYNSAAASKNPPWVRSGQNISMGVGQTGQMPPSLMANAIPPIANASVLQYPQQQVFQGQMGMQQAAINIGGIPGIPAAGNVAPMQTQLNTSQMYGAVGPVSYPTRALNSAAFQSNTTPATNASSASHTQQASTHSTNKPTQRRVFTGTVTKLQDNFGFVDEDVFFQTSCCMKGSTPQVGDRVLVEAMFNANMPFKWNATRIQVVPMARDNNMGNMQGSRGGFNNISQGTGYNAVPPPSESSMGGGGGGGGNRFSSGGGSRFSGGGGGQDRRGDRGGRDRSRQQRDDLQDMDNRKRRRDDRDKDRDDKEKERLKSPPRKRSKSPSRPARRPRRLVPRYAVQVPKIALDNTKGDVVEFKRRYTNLYIPSDFFSANFRWVDAFPLNKPISLSFPCSFHILHKEVDPILENTAVLEPIDLDYLFSAKVMLLSSPGLDDIYTKCISLADDRDKEGSRSTDDDQFSHPARLIQFLVGLRGKNETMAIGGPWSPSLDGENPNSDPGVLIKTAIRNCKALTGIDLTSCTQWFRFLEIHYHRAETIHKGKAVAARVETVVLFVPDVWSCLPTRLEWDGLHLNYQKQLARKLNKDQTSDEKESEPEVSEPKREPKHYSELDPKTMKVNELREELEARTLSPKGLKSQLIARLSKVIKTEAEEEAAKKDPPQKVDKKDEDEKKKKEEEDKKKMDDKDKSLLEKRYKLPDSPHIIVHPNRTAKSGKFDCTVMSLSSLLGYRQDDTKEHSFEVSLFAELFNEMLMRDFGFNIYKAMIAAPEKAKESKDDKDHKSKKDGKEDKDSKDKDRDKKDEEMDEDDYIDDDDDDRDKKDRRDDDKKKVEKMKLVTADPHLLLSFCYFDTTRCGYVFDKDLEDLLFSLGLSLSRAQVKKLVQKVVTRDSLHYRKLTDKPKEEAENEQLKPEDEKFLNNLALGNKRLLLEATTTSNDSSTPLPKSDQVDSETGLVNYKGTMVDVGKLLEQLSRSEASRLDTEKSLTKLRHDCNKVKENLQRSDRNNKELNMELKDFKERLSNANSELCEVNVKSRLYFTALNDIQNKIKPLLHTAESKDIEVIEVKSCKEEFNGEGERRRVGGVNKHEHEPDLARHKVKNEVSEKNVESTSSLEKTEKKDAANKASGIIEIKDEDNDVKDITVKTEENVNSAESDSKEGIAKVEQVSISEEADSKEATAGKEDPMSVDD